MRFFLCLFSFHFTVTFANDGAFYTNGNQLIPIAETTISVKKEVLTIKRIENGYARVTVSYIFDNPASDKNLLIGFEAAAPAGDVDGTPLNGQHPYISNFSVMMNGLPIGHEVAMVKDSNYYQKNTIHGVTEAEAKGTYFNENSPDFYYVYHFKAPFKKGLNSIQHTYNFKLSNSVMSHYSISYILTAANRWANNGIDDFTLIIDLGDFQHFFISKSFFKTQSDWTLDGKMIESESDLTSYLGYNNQSLEVFCKRSPLVFTKKSFHPTGELYIDAVRNIQSSFKTGFDPAKHHLPFDLESSEFLSESISENAYKILRNLPYARRGYVFKTPFIQAYYEAQKWYQPNPTYVSNFDDLTRVEQDWLNALVKP